MIGAAVVTGVRVGHLRVPESDEARALMALLTPREAARAKTIGHEMRRREHIASRVLAKYLLLDRCGSDDLVRETSAAQIGGFPPDSYREIEVVRVDGVPRVYRRGSEQPEFHVSIAHAAGCTAVGVSTDTPIGIDVATVEKREPAFYRIHFTRRERDWAEQADSESTGALYTLLWTLKESVLKAGAASHATLWGYDEIEVLIDAPAREVAGALRAGTLASMELRLPLRDDTRVGSAWAVSSRTLHQVLSFVLVSGRSSGGFDVQ